MVGKVPLEAEKNIRAIKVTVKPEGGSLHHRIFMSIDGGSPSIKMAGLSSSFQYEENNSML